MNINRLKGIMAEQGYGIKLMAEKIKMSKNTLYRRINGRGDDFTIGEVMRLSKALNLTIEDIINIFFTELSHKKA